LTVGRGGAFRGAPEAARRDNPRSNARGSGLGSPLSSICETRGKTWSRHNRGMDPIDHPDSGGPPALRQTMGGRPVFVEEGHSQGDSS
jgi:hypothetical protein